MSDSCRALLAASIKVRRDVPRVTWSQEASATALEVPHFTAADALPSAESTRSADTRRGGGEAYQARTSASIRWAEHVHLVTLNYLAPVLPSQRVASRVGMLWDRW